MMDKKDDFKEELLRFLNWQKNNVLPNTDEEKINLYLKESSINIKLKQKNIECTHNYIDFDIEGYSCYKCTKCDKIK